jgi:hypothetical protein
VIDRLAHLPIENSKTEGAPTLAPENRPKR